MISIEEIENLIALARLELSPEEKERLRKDIGAILEYVSQIKEATADLSTTVDHDLINVLRDDVDAYEGGQFTELLLSAAPRREGNYFRVKKILQQKPWPQSI